MDIFNRIRKLFSSSDSSSTDRFPPHGHRTEGATEFEHVVERSLNPHSNVHAGRLRTSNVTNVRPSSNITSIVTRTSIKSYIQPDLQSQRKNARKGFKDIVSLSENANHSTKCVKTSDTPTNLSIFPRSIGSQVYCYDQSEISSENDSVQKYQNPTPRHSKPTSEECSTTDLNIPQSTLKTKFVDLDRSCQSRYPTITSEQALNAKESNTAVMPGHCECLLPPVPSHNSISTTVSCHKSSFAESNLQTLNSSSRETTRSLHPRVTPVSAVFVPYRQSTSEESHDDIVIKSQYSLRNFSTKLQTPPKDKSFKAENDVIYHNQWTEFTAQILDELNNPVCSQKSVEVSSNSRHVVIQENNIKIEKGRLHFRMKCSATGNISILIKIDNFALTKDFDVTSNPCSSYLSDMTIEKLNPAEQEFVFRVFIFDVFGEPVPSNSTANCKLGASFQSTGNKVVRKVEHNTEQEQICYDITVRGERPWSQDFVVLLNGEQISHPREFEFTDEECKAINDIDDEDYEWIRQFFDEDDHGIFILLTTVEDDGTFIAYDENDCELESQNAKTLKLVCKNARKYDILGEDCAHINNIKRVLELKDRVEVQETDGCAIIALRNIKSHLHPICKEVVQHLLRGLYYRRKASEAAIIRMKWKNRLIGIDEVLWLDRKTPSFVFCKYFKDFFGDLMNKYNREACDELFKFFNFQRDESEVDLHGLLVADEKKLESLRLNLLIGSLGQEQIKKILEICRIKSKEGRERQTLRKKFRNGEEPESLVKIFIGGRKGGMDDKSLDDLEHECSDEDCSLRSNEYFQKGTESSTRCNDGNGDVDVIIRRCRLESDEAIRKLEEKLDRFINLENAVKNNTPWLEIIVGAGRHSKKNKQNIRPKVEKLLKERNLKFAPVNKGSLVVTFLNYSGPEPCFGEYYCEKCDRCWKSSKSYVRKYQKCASCKANCWPVKQREKDKVANYRRDGAWSVKRQSKPHQSILCQKCQELRRPCNERRCGDSY